MRNWFVSCSSHAFIASFGLFALGGQPVAAQQGAEAPGALDDIVVTAQKRAEDVQDVPLSVLAFGEAALDRLNARQLTDLERAAPNVSFGGGAGGSFNAIGIRGVIDSSRNIGIDARVSVYVDGVYIGRSYATDQSLIGIETVEILRGPQGTLFGKNTVAGALNITTRKPGADFETQLEAEYGSYDYLRLAGRTNVPLGDTAAIAISLNRESRDGYARNLFLDRRMNDLDRWSGRVQLRVQPTERLTIDLAADGLDENRNVSLYEGISGLPEQLAPGPYTVAHDTAETDSLSYYGLSGTGEYALGDDLTLTSITAYRNARYDFLQEEDYLPVFVSRSNFNEKSRQFTQELRLASADDRRLTWLAGLFYLNETLETQRRSEGGEALGFGYVHTPGRVGTNSYAAFVSGTYALTESFRLDLGARLTHETKKLRFSIVDTVGLFTNVDNFRDNRADTDFSPRIGFQFNPQEDVMLFGSVSRGFKSGGWNADTITTLEGIAFDPETVTNFELGVKSTLLDGRLRANLTGFVTKYDDFQVFQFITLSNGGTLITFTNAGKVTSKGVEAEFQAAPVEGLLLTASGAYTRARFDRFANGGGLGVDYDGHDLPFAPRVKYFLAADYRLPIGPGELLLHADYAHTASQYTSSSNSPQTRLDAYGLLGARIAYEMENGVELSVDGQNLTDSQNLRSRDTSFLGAERGRYEMPRTFGARLRVKF